MQEEIGAGLKVPSDSNLEQIIDALTEAKEESQKEGTEET
jgi:hypothetical protein